VGRAAAQRLGSAQLGRFAFGEQAREGRLGLAALGLPSRQQGAVPVQLAVQFSGEVVGAAGRVAQVDHRRGQRAQEHQPRHAPVVRLVARGHRRAQQGRRAAGGEEARVHQPHRQAAAAHAAQLEHHARGVGQCGSGRQRPDAR
jgi:hypothetical protein